MRDDDAGFTERYDTVASSEIAESDKCAIKRLIGEDMGGNGCDGWNSVKFTSGDGCDGRTVEKVHDMSSKRGYVLQEMLVGDTEKGVCCPAISNGRIM